MSSCIGGGDWNLESLCIPIESERAVSLPFTLLRALTIIILWRIEPFFALPVVAGLGPERGDGVEIERLRPLFKLGFIVPRSPTCVEASRTLRILLLRDERLEFEELLLCVSLNSNAEFDITLFLLFSALASNRVAIPPLLLRPLYPLLCTELLLPSKLKLCTYKDGRRLGGVLLPPPLSSTEPSSALYKANMCAAPKHIFPRALVIGIHTYDSA
mmetsp:Transcript_16372/g.22839  ORF Transcript_16372/g.22839 Transcript_16372/m.22839 type:complete len:215 (+) Transcript_16372:812-1456(+)